ncbi:hypothetical protein N7465_009705 [Penicillium sp. CMV-2018d]|nr:hypothetical protein N7465_009705 [Penicillium sp. CMV-2018d]
MSDGPHSMTAGSTNRQYCLEHDIFYGVTKSQPIRTDAHASVIVIVIAQNFLDKVKEVIEAAKEILDDVKEVV